MPCVKPVFSPLSQLAVKQVARYDYEIPRFLLLLVSHLPQIHGRRFCHSQSTLNLGRASMGLPGAGTAANGGGMAELLGRKSRYVRMDDVLPPDPEVEKEEGVGGGVRVRGGARRHVFFCSVFASLNHVLLGYDVGVMSGCIIFIQKDLHIDQVQQEVLVGCLSFISLLGSLAAGRTSDAIGRKRTIGLAAAIFQAGAAVMALAPSFAALMAGRLLAGVGIGFGLMVAPVYISEISPAALRGSLASLPEIFISFGILLGYVSNLAFAGLPDHVNWRVMLAAGILPSISVAYVLTVIPESPRWLVIQGRTGEARAVLLTVTDTEGEAQERLAEIEESARVTSAGKAVWREIMRPSPVIRRMLIAGLGVQFFQQATGIDALVYYSPTIFRDAGIATEGHLLAATVAVGLSKTIFIVIAILLVDHVGRKPLLLISTVGITACLAVLAATLSLLARGALPGGAAVALAIVTVCGFVAFFSVGIGPINMVLSSEIYPLRLRAQAVGLGLAVNRLTSGAVAMSFLSICNAASVAGAFTAFAAVSALSVAFVHWFVPETSGKTLEEIELLFGEAGGSRGVVELGDGEHLVHGRCEPDGRR
ncbi:probable polyol transporter 4 isoform X1 [Aegilops tauschii subsp. strangulata]|nr:probable polyol transporter 4 isoform X1 [Aegilops tauschii subsp. strangulata]